MKDEIWAAPTASDPLGLIKRREHARVHDSALPGADTRRKLELRAMYAAYPPAVQKMLRAARVQRGIDAVDCFHAMLRCIWPELTEEERAQFRKASTITNRMQRRLRETTR